MSHPGNVSDRSGNSTKNTFVVAAAGYQEHEFFIVGKADAYDFAGSPAALRYLALAGRFFAAPSSRAAAQTWRSPAFHVAAVDPGPRSSRRRGSSRWLRCAPVFCMLVQ